MKPEVDESRLDLIRPQGIHSKASEIELQNILLIQSEYKDHWSLYEILHHSDHRSDLNFKFKSLT